MDTKERRTPSGARFNAGPDLAPDTANCGKTELEKCRSGFKRSPQFFCAQSRKSQSRPQAPQFLFCPFGKTSQPVAVFARKLSIVQ